MKDILNQLFEGKKLSKEQAKETLIGIASGNYNNSQVAAFITSFLMRNIAVEELEGFRDALLELCIPTDLSEYDPMDLCGTGGDGKNAINISTIASFVVAGAGIKVAKHGNYGVSSMVGSSNVLEYLGVRFTNDINTLRKQIEATGITFLHAPLFHPALKNLAPIRKELGVKTFFNVLGPMVNPTKPNKQIVGVYSLELLRLYTYIYQKTNKRFLIIHSLDGFDEVSLTSDFKLSGNEGSMILAPSELGLHKWQLPDLAGGNTLEEAAKILVQILENKGTKAQNEVIAANAGLSIYCAKGGTISMTDAIALASETLQSGKAYTVFKSFMNLMPK